MKPFEFDANKYSAGSAHQKEWGKRIIAELPIKGDESILDLGCGDGVLTGQLAALVPDGRAIGIDASENMIKKANELTAGNLSFVRMDINDLDFNEEFDLIFSNATLHWVKDHVRLLSNCHRALKPGGIIRFNFAGHGNCSNFNAIVQQVMASDAFAPCFRVFTWPWYMPKMEEYENLIKNGRFTEMKLWEENADRHFPTQEEMIKWIDQPSLVPFLKEIVDKDRATFRNAVVERMVQATRQPDGRCFETFRRINILARK